MADENPNENMQVSAIDRVEEDIPVPAPTPSSQMPSMTPSADTYPRCLLRLQ